MLEGLGWEPLLVTLAGVPAGLAALFLQSVLLGEGRIVAYNAVDVGQNALTFAVLLAGFALLDLRVTGVLLVIGAGRLAAALVYLILLARRSGVRRVRTSGSCDDARYGFRVYVAILLSFLVIRLDLLLVNAYAGAHEAGLYSVAATLADGMYVLPMVIGLNLFPRVARGVPTQQSAEVFRSVSVLYGLVCLATVPIAGPAIRGLFGASTPTRRRSTTGCYRASTASGCLTILSFHFAGRGYPARLMAVWVAGLALNIAINVASCRAAAPRSPRLPPVSRTRSCSPSTWLSSPGRPADSERCGLGLRARWPVPACRPFARRVTHWRNSSV